MLLYGLPILLNLYNQNTTTAGKHFSFATVIVLNIFQTFEVVNNLNLYLFNYVVITYLYI